MKKLELREQMKEFQQEQENSKQHKKLQLNAQIPEPWPTRSKAKGTDTEFKR